MSNWTIKENSQGELNVIINGETWKKAQDKAFDKLAKNVEIKGFRKGQAPKNMVAKQINSQEIWLEAVDVVAQDALTEGIKEHDLWLIARPELKVNDINAEQVDLTFIVTVKPTVELGAYKNLPYNVEKTEVSKEEVDAELTKLQNQYTELEVKEEGTVGNGDTAVIDFEGFKDGVAFEGGKGENHPLEIGSGSFIPGFEEQLVGCTIGEEKDVEVSFPEEYHAEDLKGQAVVFKVKVNEIKTKRVPELNDDLAKDVNIENVETMEALTAYITTNLQASKDQEAENEALNKVLDEVCESAKCDIPEVMITEECEEMLRDYGMRLQQQGFGLDQFMQMTGQSKEQMLDQFKTDAQKRVKLRLVLEEVAKVENIEVTDAQIDEEYQKIADQYQMEVDKVKELIPSENLSYDVKLQQALAVVKGQ